MAESFYLPDLGEGVHEAEVLAIHVEPGQNVIEGDIILEVETDKAAVEIPSPFTGTVMEVHVQASATVKVGSSMISYSRQEDGKDQGTTPVSQESKGQPKTIVPASPATRKLARELGVDLHQVKSTGANGVVTAQDVRDFSTTKMPSTKPSELVEVQHSGASESLPNFSTWGEITREPLRSIRRATANQMAKSWAEIPHVTTQDSIDITRLEAFRLKHKEELLAAGGRLTLTVFALKAAATALKKYPRFNGSIDMEAQEMIIKNYFHIGVATNTERGLLVPVIKDVDRKSIKEIAIELHEKVEKTRAGKIAREELQGGTFTITNAGAAGGGTFTAIINHPEVAIMGLGQARMQPMAIARENGEYDIEPRLMMPIVLCFDHRVVDGADAINFLRVVIEALEDPDELLITMV